MEKRCQQTETDAGARSLVRRGMRVKTGLRAGLDSVVERGPGEGGIFEPETSDLISLDPSPVPWRGVSIGE